MAASCGLQLNVVRKKLNDAIGDDFKVYLRSMKLWFRQKITKEEFDIEARKFLNEETVHLHNDFLLAILNKCQSLCSPTSAKDVSHTTNHASSKDKVKKGKPKKKRSRPIRHSFDYRFQASSPLLYAPQAISKDPTEENRVSFCARDWTLPDISMIHGRMFVTAWDCGLDSVEDEAVQALMTAVHLCLKQLLAALLATKSAYRLREGKFKYAVGTPSVNPYLKNASKILNYDCTTSVSNSGEQVPGPLPTIDWAESQATFGIACDTPTIRPNNPITFFHLLETMQVHRNILPSHSVWSVNMEHLLCRLWHPSHEEIEQESIHWQEERLKRRMLEDTQFL